MNNYKRGWFQVTGGAVLFLSIVALAGCAQKKCDLDLQELKLLEQKRLHAFKPMQCPTYIDGNGRLVCWKLPGMSCTCPPGSL